MEQGNAYSPADSAQLLPLSSDEDESKDDDEDGEQNESVLKTMGAWKSQRMSREDEDRPTYGHGLNQFFVKTKCVIFFRHCCSQRWSLILVESKALAGCNFSALDNIFTATFSLSLSLLTRVMGMKFSSIYRSSLPEVWPLNFAGGKPYPSHGFWLKVF